VGTVLGTYQYMSPEQLEGRAVDARSDIFSFGVVVYEMVTGRRPFAGDSRVALMAAIVGSEPAAPSTLQALTPPALERLIGRCLAKDPDDRWQDVRDIAAELRWLSDTGSGSSKAPAAPRARRRPAVLIAALATAGVGAAGLGAVLLLGRATPPVPSFGAVTFRRGVVTGARFAPDGQSIVYSASWQGGPHDVYLGRALSSDARSLQLAQGRILSVSSSGDLAVLFGRQMIPPTLGTLARLPLDGGARRDLLERVIGADWIPGTDDLAVVRLTEAGASQVEFPIGTKVHESPASWSLRVSPDGGRIAFFDGPQIFGASPNASLIVIDRSGTKSTIVRNMSGLGLAWAPSGREVWFTATTGRPVPSLHAVSLSGSVREIYRAPDWLILHDISPDGKVLMTRNSIRIAMSCQAVGESVERDLTWLFASRPHALSRDGRSVIFAEVLGVTEPGTDDVYRRPLDGGPAVRLGTGAAQGLSPDGRWVLARATAGWSLLPTGAGSAVALPKGTVARIRDGGWLDDARVVFNGQEDGATERSRVFLQTVPDGLPRAVTGEGVVLAAKAPTPDGRSILVRSDAGWQLHPLSGGSPRPVPGLNAGDDPLQWSSDGRVLYAADRSGGRGASLNVFRIEVATGRRALWRTLAPSDSVGVDSVATVALGADATAYCYSHLRRLGDLFIVEGLR
jgi:hypothetical protein